MPVHQLNSQLLIKHSPQFTYDDSGVLFSARSYKDQNDQPKIHWDVYKGNDYHGAFVRVGHPSLPNKLHFIQLEIFKRYSQYTNLCNLYQLEPVIKEEYDLLIAKLNKLYHLNIV
ncbi:hypothetical protein AVT69_gp122 [Pseudomonas phage PhiPA3]|uniref:Uncharacterized protein 123 n=1 Tax=Pseudomonas phage PhiPA3 TaxID=998086 RepID=F8SJZ7_BPPA3|nr:hypothetical protein AVT69_gp122 [Pseudomonas phage PhiPA3]AEH03547.1 hypothetical protein [Pseudomonas phage PhiPA3]